MHPNHMLRAMVDDRRRQVISDAGTLRPGAPARSGAVLDRISRLARRGAVSWTARAGQPIAGPVAVIDPQT